MAKALSAVNVIVITQVYYTKTGSLQICFYGFILEKY